MERKKLITLIAVGGILLCGACFLPPPPPPRIPPTAPIRIGLRDSRRIRVEVTQAPSSDHINPHWLDGFLVQEIDSRLRSLHLKAYIDGAPEAGDAVLRVSILQESVTSEPATDGPGASMATYSITLNCVLTAGDGAIVWREDNRVYTSQKYPLALSERDAWSQSGHWLQYSIAPTLATQMIEAK